MDFGGYSAQVSKQLIQPFQLIAGAVALDLVNTLDNRFQESGGKELLPSYAHLLKFLTQSQLLSIGQAQKLSALGAASGEGEQTVEDVRRLRETVAGISYQIADHKSISGDQLETLEAFGREANSHRALTGKDGRVRWAWRHLTSSPAAPLWLLAQESMEFFLSDPGESMKACGSATCRWLFLDTSKNHMRRWCDMKLCGNRMKARRFQERLRSVQNC